MAVIKQTFLQYTCDRCKCVADTPEKRAELFESGSIIAGELRIGRHGSKSTDLEFDLCAPCVLLLVEFLGFQETLVKLKDGY